MLKRRKTSIFTYFMRHYFDAYLLLVTSGGGEASTRPLDRLVRPRKLSLVDKPLFSCHTRRLTDS